MSAPKLIERVILFAGQTLVVGMLLALFVVLTTIYWFGMDWSSAVAAAATIVTIALLA